MKTAIQSLGLVVAFFLFLSITVSGTPLFVHIYGLTAPVTKGVQSAVEDFVSRSADGTRTYSKRLFENSLPRVGGSKLPATAIGTPAELVSEKDKERLEALIKNH